MQIILKKVPQIPDAIKIAESLVPPGVFMFIEQKIKKEYTICS